MIVCAINEVYLSLMFLLTHWIQLSSLIAFWYWLLCESKAGFNFSMLHERSVSKYLENYIVLNIFIGLFITVGSAFIKTLLYQAVGPTLLGLLYYTAEYANFHCRSWNAHFVSKISCISNHFFGYSVVSTALAFLLAIGFTDLHNQL